LLTLIYKNGFYRKMLGLENKNKLKKIYIYIYKKDFYIYEMY
jgi:hypothetical protein